MLLSVSAACSSQHVTQMNGMHGCTCALVQLGSRGEGEGEGRGGENGGTKGERGRKGEEWR